MVVGGSHIRTAQLLCGVGSVGLLWQHSTGHCGCNLPLLCHWQGYTDGDQGWGSWDLLQGEISEYQRIEHASSPHPPCLTPARSWEISIPCAQNLWLDLNTTGKTAQCVAQCKIAHWSTPALLVTISHGHFPNIGHLTSLGECVGASRCGCRKPRRWCSVWQPAS